jgi:probable phosphoglycerate mutase
MKLLLNTDGGSRGNPGPAAYGYVVQDITNLDAVKILEKCGNYLGTTTNNIAEYEGILAGVKWVVAHHPNAELIVKMDSLLIVNQIKGIFKVKNPGLLPKFHEVRELLSQLPKWSIEHTYREGNSLADSLVNEALDHIKRE